MSSVDVIGWVAAARADSMALARSAIVLGHGIFDFGFLIFDFPEEAAAGSASVRARADCLVPAEEGFLIIGAEPADVALGFFGGALGIEGDDAFEDLGVGEGPGPAVGVGHGGVEVVVELLEGGDERGFVEGFVFGCEGFAGADLFEDVVDVGEAEAVLRLGALAVGVE